MLKFVPPLQLITRGFGSVNRNHAVFRIVERQELQPHRSISMSDNSLRVREGNLLGKLRRASSREETTIIIKRDIYIYIPLRIRSFDD